MKNKIQKNIFFFMLFILPLSPLALVSCGEFGNVADFTGIGSNSVSPLVMGKDSFMTTNPVGQYIYQNTGSGDGYKSQMQDPGSFQSDFGMTSSHKNPITYSNHNAQKQKQLEYLWSKKQLRTITYAFDAIAIGVHLPKGIRLKSSSSIPIINLQQLAYLYSRNKKLIQSVTWGKILENEANEANSVYNTRPIAISIKGGKETSGKSEAFVNVIDKQLAKEAQNPEQEQVVISQQKFTFTDSFKDIYQENLQTKGSIAYYSLGQISKHKSGDIKIASINTLSLDVSKEPTIELVQKKQYNWSRPFNMIYSVTNNKAIAFANYLLSPHAQKIIKSKNFVPLNSTQIQLQLPTWQADLPFKGETGINGMARQGMKLEYGL